MVNITNLIGSYMSKIALIKSRLRQTKSKQNQEKYEISINKNYKIINNKSVFKETNYKNGNFYFLSNDHVSDLNPPFDAAALMGICNPYLLHVISTLLENNIKIKKIIAFDNNMSQIKHFGHIINTIINSKNRIDFIEQLAFVKFNRAARNVLIKYEANSRNPIKGWLIEDNAYPSDMEKAVWKNSRFDRAKFKKKYHMDAEKTDRGILIRNIRTAGLHKKGCITIFSGDVDLYPEGPFMFSYGYGYLKSEKVFRMFKNTLIKIKNKMVFINGDIYEVLKDSLIQMRYYNIITWTSNIFAPYFVNKYPTVSKTLELFINRDLLTTISSKRIYHILVNDVGTNLEKLSNFNVSFNSLDVHDSHWAAYTKVNGYFEEKNLHVIAGKLIEEVTSTNDELHSTKVVSYNQLYKLSDTYDSAFLHTIYGRGHITEEELIDVIKKCTNISRLVLVLEHNDTPELRQERKNGYDGRFITNELINKIQSGFYILCKYKLPGRISNNRNSLFVIKGLLQEAINK